MITEIDDGSVGASSKGDLSRHSWCVRGGQVYDGQDVKEVIDALP